MNYLINQIKQLTTLLDIHNVDALLINSEPNRLWFLKEPSSAGFLFILKNKKPVLWIDGRYYQHFSTKLQKDVDVFLYQNPKQIADFCSKNSIKKLLVEDIYTNINTFFQYEKLWKVKCFTFDADVIRVVKNELEIQLLQKAADIAAETIDFAKLNLKAGMTEKSAATMLKIYMLQNYDVNPSFEPIVAFGENGANPHHHPSDKQLELHGLVTIDLGCIYEGYCSDITRTFAVENSILPKQLQDYHDAVLQSQFAGLKKAIVNNKCMQIDQECRKYLANRQLDQYFVHSTGHGLGINVHEQPFVSAKSETILTNNMVITIEPGIYIPNVAGIRIEDSIVIKDNEPIILTNKSCKKSNW